MYFINPIGNITNFKDAIYIHSLDATLFTYLLVKLTLHRNVDYHSNVVISQQTKPTYIFRYIPERNANRFKQTQDIEQCNCITPIYPAKTRFTDQSKSEQAAMLNRSFVSLPKLENINLSQVSLDRRSSKYRPKHSHVCEQNQRIIREMEKGASLRRIQSPEIINIHREPMYGGHESDSCAVKEFKCKEFEFARGQSVRTGSSR